jgi:hypothetical protein
MAGVTRNLGNAVWSYTNPMVSVSAEMQQKIVKFLDEQPIATCVAY